MAGEATPLAPPEPVAGEAPAAAAASPAAAPVTPAEPVTAPVVEPVAPAAPAAEPTLLEKFDAEQAAKKPSEEPKPEVKPADPAKPVEAAKPEEKKPEAPEVPAAPQPVAYEYTLPDTIKMDDALKGTFHSALDAFRADPAKGVQGLIDLHNQTMQQFADQTYQNQVSTFNDTRRSWVTQTMADDDLGGAGHQTSMAAIARMRDLLVPESKREAFNQFLAVTGAGDHPEFLRLLHNAARIYDEAPMPPPGARPPPNLGKPQGRGLRGMYKSTNGQGRQ